MNRREALKTVAATGVATSLPFVSGNAATGTELLPPVTGPRMNFEQADKVMTQLGLDGLVLSTGMNFQHATGIRPVISRMGRTPSAIAIVTRRPAERLAIVAAAFSYYYTMADVHRAGDVPVYVYTAPGGDIHEHTSEAAPLRLFHDREEAPVDEIERSRRAAIESVATEKGRHSTIERALAEALKDLGLQRGRLAIDHGFVERAVSTAAPATTVVAADDALRRIRPIKSPIEIELMRRAASGNAAAALEAVRTIRPGSSYRDLRAQFFTAAARRGHRGVFMVVDRTSDELYDNTFKEGQALLIDCVSEYEGYHGDYGRTVFIGEPHKAIITATNAIRDAWDKVREQLKPGLRFSDIHELGQKALRQGGKRYLVPFSPHSVGLYHTDHVGTTGLPPREDMALEPGMILSIDCPLVETGVGGSAHLEDLMLITADGSEPINDTGHQVITV